MSDLLHDAVHRLLMDQCTPAVIRAIEAGGDAAALWQNLEDTGFVDALVPESLGGAGMGLADVYSVLEACGAFAVPVPVGETLLARGLLAHAGLAITSGSISLGRGRLDPDGQLHTETVPLGRVARNVLVSFNNEYRLLPADKASRTVAGFCLDVIMIWPEQHWRKAQVLNLTADLKLLQAALYAAELAGALMTVLSLTLQYANDRQQFGKPIGKFQAIQHQLSLMSEHTFAARMAAQIGLNSAGIELDRLRVAIAKARTSEAALEVAALSHSIHGAIGFTSEFDLQLFTRRLHAWRQAGGTESHWHDVVGAQLLEHPSALSLDLIREATDLA